MKQRTDTDTQRRKVLLHLRASLWITQREALELYGIGRLAARVHELRRLGFKIKTDPSRGYAVYTLEGEPAGQVNPNTEN
jgi:biotin operon repressor